jgi:glutamate synthase (NADPH/NADH) large chain
VRELLAELGFTSMDEAVGQVEVLNMNRAITHWKADGLNLEPILHIPDVGELGHRRHMKNQDHGLERALDQELIRMSADALATGLPTKIDVPIRNVNRTVGTMLGSEITRRGGLPDGTIDISFTGSAGQSFGAFIPRGLTLRLVGDANDYVGKGLSGGRIVVRPDAGAPFEPSENTIAGNVIGYGATSGELFLRGQVGERFCVRNSGAHAVAEGVGDHGCEYMTGGRVAVLGSTGRNFGAGMSGGIAYLLDLDPSLVNHELVELNQLDETDARELFDLISQHVRHTGSTKGSGLLATWTSALTRFTKVIPRDYKRVLEIEADALSRGEDPMLAIMNRV